MMKSNLPNPVCKLKVNKMKNFLRIFLLVVLVMSGLNVSNVYAESNEVASLIGVNGQLENAITFEQLGYTEVLLVGPFDSTRVNFGLPANVNLASGSSLFLDYAVAWSGSGEVNLENSILGTLLVYFNDELIDTIILNGAAGTSKEILIPENAFDVVEEDGRHRLRLLLNADVNCNFDNVQTTLIVSKASRFDLQYSEIEPTIDLSLLPLPIFQPDAIFPSSALIVVPDTPEAFELQSAMAISAGLGSITGGELSVNLITNGNLTPELVASNHLIFVGLGNKFSNLQVAELPFSVGGDSLALPQDNLEDGVVEMSRSPWSDSHAVLYIGGNSPDAVVKAAQVFSSGDVVAVEKPDVSLIENVNSTINDQVVFIDRTFRELGYESRTMGLFGENFFSYMFNATSEQVTSTGAYVDLILSHSDLIDLESTGLTVILNDDVVGGVRLSEESPVTTRIKLSPDSLRRGLNRLELVSEIVPYYSCYSSGLQGTWITISESSSIHLPISEQKIDLGSNANLQEFPQMFLTSTDLGDLAVVLPRNDLASWSSASKAMFYIGNRAELPIASLKVFYGDEVSDEILNEYNILAFGRSSTLPFLSKINDFLPAPFNNGTDEAVQPSMFVNYSLLPDTSVGYLQVLVSPFNPEKVIMAVLGNTALGVPMAGTTLTQDVLVSQLSGNFSIVYEDQIVSTDTRLGISKQGIVSELPVAVTVTPAVVETSASPLQDTQIAIQERPVWIIPAILITSAVMVLVIIFLAIRGMAGRKSHKSSKNEENGLPKDNDTESKQE